MKRALISSACALCLLTFSGSVAAAPEPEATPGALLETALAESHAPGGVPPSVMLAQADGESMTVLAQKGWEAKAPDLTTNEILRKKMEVLDFRDAPLQDVLRLIARKANLNILMNPEIVTGSVTLHLENVELGVALDNILKTQDLAFVVSPGENIVRIVQASFIGQTGIETVTDVIYLEYLDAERVAADLQQLFVQLVAQRSVASGGGADLENVQEQAVAIAYHKESNSLLVTAPPPTLANIKSIVAELDKSQNRTPMIETSTIQLNWLDAVETAVDLNLVFAEDDAEDEIAGDKYAGFRLKVKGIKENTVRIVPQKAANSIIITAPPAITSAIIDLVRELDVPQRQVRIEARLVD
ncbi:hypothetical protein HQ520_05960, partial [bacterium]|nr:hypothetical protein [bacterium]